MKKIKDLYLKEAINIRLKYLELIEENNNIEFDVNQYQNKIIDMKNKLLQLNDSTDPEQQKQLYDIMIEFEQSIHSLQNKSKPIIDEMKILQDRASILYKKIMQEYPNNTEEEVKVQLFKQLEEKGIK